jgi:hypothetical protein
MVGGGASALHLATWTPRLPGLAELRPADRLLIDCLRRDRGDSPSGVAVFLALVEACGHLAGDHAHTAFRRFVAVLRRYGRRPLRLAEPTADGLWPDELAVLNLVGCARCRDDAMACCRAEWLVGCAGREVCCRAAQNLAAALRAAELRVCDGQVVAEPA